jgi:hypothetical protein
VVKISESLSKVEIGISGRHTRNGTIRADEFLTDLKGRRAILKYREMRDNDPVIGAICYATEQILRDVPYEVKPAGDSEAAKSEAEFVESVLCDMEHSLGDHISQALSFLHMGFASFEVVYKRRISPTSNNPKKKSKYTDGRLGVRKLAPRAQWTINEFVVDQMSGEFLGIRQDYNFGMQDSFIPASKLVHYRTPTINNDPSGRSVLRNAYSSYVYLSNLQSIEAIAVERELHGVPIGRMPADYLSPSATDEQIALKNSFSEALRDLKNNEQGFILLPSDLYMDNEGKPTSQRIMDVELITSNGSRSIDVDPIIRRYQHDIARSVMAEFLMLGGGSNGSYALSKSKTDLFLRSMESYISSLFDALNKQLVEKLWELNGLDYELMPTIVAGDVAPHDLKELGSYLRNLNGANIDLSDEPEIVNALLNTAELPKVNEEDYRAKVEMKRQAEIDAKNANPAPQPKKPVPTDKEME